MTLLYFSLRDATPCWYGASLVLFLDVTMLGNGKILLQIRNNDGELVSGAVAKN